MYRNIWFYIKRPFAILICKIKGHKREGLMFIDAMLDSDESHVGEICARCFRDIPMKGSEQ